MSLELPPLLKFYNALLLPKEQRQEDVQQLLSAAKKDFQRRYEMMNSSNKRSYIKEIIGLIDRLSEKIPRSNIKEIELSEKLKSFLLTASGNTKEIKRFPEIFRDKRAYEFFIETLDNFGRFDSSGNLKEPFQPILNAIRKNDFYKDNILQFRLKLKDYVEALNEHFGEDMNTSKLSAGDDLDNELTKFYKENFHPNKSE